MTIDAQRHSAEMAAQRAQELAGDDRHYMLRKACVARAVELYDTLAWIVDGTRPVGNANFAISATQLLKEIEHDAQ